MLANSGVYFLVLWHCKRVKKALSQEVLQERKWNNPRASYGEGPCWTTGSAWEQKKLGAVFITSMNGTTTHQAENLELSLNPLMPIASTCNLPASPFDFTSKMNYKSVFCSPSHVYNSCARLSSSCLDYYKFPVSQIHSFPPSVHCLHGSQCNIEHKLLHATLLLKSPAASDLPQNKVKIPDHSFWRLVQSSACLEHILLALNSFQCHEHTKPWNFSGDFGWALFFSWKCSPCSAA